MKVTVQLPDKFKNVNPLNIVVPFDFLVYRVDYNYLTSRSNEKSNSKYFIISDKINKLGLGLKYSVGTKEDNNNFLNSILAEFKNSNILEVVIKDQIIRPIFFKWINDFNSKYPFRMLSNIEITNIHKVCTITPKIKNNKLILESNSSINTNDIINTHSTIDINEVNLGYTSIRANKKNAIKYVVNPILDQNYSNDLLNVYENHDLSDLIKFHYNREHFKNRYVDRKRNNISNVKILDICTKYSLSFQ